MTRANPEPRPLASSAVKVVMSTREKPFTAKDAKDAVRPSEVFADRGELRADSFAYFLPLG